MKHPALAAGLLVLVGIGPIGCKSASSLAWWKNNKAGESTAIAHSAPQLPSDAAKKAEARQVNAAQLAGGEAAPFKPAAAPTGATATAAANYPQTSAPPFTPSTTAQVAATAPSAQPSSTASLGSIAMPYDPSKAPQAKSTTSSAATTAAASVDRYGTTLANVAASAPATGASSAPAYGQPPSDAAAPAFDPGAQMNQAVAAASGAVDRYATSTIEAAQGAGTAAANSIGGAVNDAIQTAASPYADSRYGVAPASSTYASGVLPSTMSASVVTSTPYRPGGTSSYPGSTLDAGVQVASRPSPTTSAAVPDVAVPNTTTTQPAAPSRY